MFCPKCGEKNKEGAKFCNKCGESFEKSTTASAKKVSIDTKELTNNIVDLIKGLIVKPIDTFKKYGEEKNFTLSIILVAVLSLITGLFVISLMKNAYSLIVGSFGSLGGLYNYSSYNIDIPYAKSFFLALFATFIFAFAFVGILYLVNTKIFKGKESFKKTFAIYGTISVAASITLLVSTILMFISFSLASIILSLGLTLTGFYTYHMIKMVGPKDENKHGYIYVVSTGLFFLFVFIVIKIFC